VVRSICFSLLLAAAAPAVAAEPTAGSEPKFTIRIRDHQFHPAELKVPAGVAFRIVVENDDGVVDEFDSYVLHREKHVRPKSKATLLLGPLEAGRYPFKGEEHHGAEVASGVLVVR
jgi:hypothetical protein